MQGQDQYMYTAVFGATERQLQPINQRTNRESFNSQLEERRFAFSNDITGTLIFNNDNGDFDFFYDLEVSGNKCRPITIKIDQLCGGTSYQPWRTVTMRLVDGDWDIDRCILQIKTTPVNSYTCLDENREDEINLFEGPLNRVKATILRGTIELHQYTSTTYEFDKVSEFGGVAPGSIGWKAYRVEYLLTPLPHHYNFYYAREKAVLPYATDPGPGWILLIDNPPTNKTWARKPILADYTKLYVNNQVPGDGEAPIRHFGGDLFAYNVVGGDIVPDALDNGIPLNDIFTFYMNRFCAIPVKSDFFQINPEAPYTTTYPTLRDRSNDFDIIFQKSDVKRPGATNNATKAITTFEKVLNGICEIYNLYYTIRNGQLIIEHASWFVRNTTIDLTVNKYKRRLIFTRRYTYTTNKLPKFEKYSWMDQQGNKDFVGLPIEYTGGCVTTTKTGIDKKHEIDDITTDMEFCLINSDPDSKNVTDEGLVLVSAKKEGDIYYVQMVDPILESDYHLNNLLGWAYLHNQYHRYDRLQKNGYMNGSYGSFITTRPIKKRQRISITFCCDDAIDLTGKVVTDMGDAEVDAASYNFFGEVLELDLLYQDTVGNNACLRPRSFTFVERNGDDFTFNTVFEDAGTYHTQIEILAPDGSITYIDVPADSNGNMIHNLPGLPEGLYRFRKRIVCDVDFYGEWTNYTSASVAPPLTCPDYTGTIQFLRHGSQFSFFIFRFTPEIYPAIAQAEVTRPDGIVYVINQGVGTLTGLGYQDITFDVFLVPFSPPPGSGLYKFRFRKLCDAASNLYSGWTAFVNVNT